MASGVQSFGGLWGSGVLAVHGRGGVVNWRELKGVLGLVYNLQRNYGLRDSWVRGIDETIVEKINRRSGSY
jgi:hypothetical protein